jgi:hypothetical protein
VSRDGGDLRAADVGSGAGAARGQSAARARGERLALFLALVVIGSVYAHTLARLARFRAFWSPDAGALFAMVRSWVETGDPVHLRYAYAAQDPTGLVHPLQGGYLIHTPGGFGTVYGPAYPLLAGVFYRVLGFTGLAVPSAIAALLACLAVYGAARALGLRSRLLTPLVLGLCTPVVVYAAVFWHHALTIAATAAFLWLAIEAWRSGRVSLAVAGGAVLGIGLFVHELACLMFGAAMLALTPDLKDLRARRMGRGLAMGFGLCAAAWMAQNVVIYGSAAGPHVTGPNSPLGAVYRSRLLSVQAVGERAAVQLLGFEWPDADAGAMAVFGVAAVIAGWVAWWKEARAWRWAGVGCVVLMGWAAVSSWPRETVQNGLLQTTPLFGLALCIPWLRRRTDPAPEGARLAWLSRLCWLFLAGVVLTPVPPLLGWGSRFMVTASPALVLLGAHGLELLWAEARPLGKGVVGIVAGAALLLGASAQSRGVGVVARDLAFSRKLCDSVEELNEVLVTDWIWVPAELQAANLGKPIFLVGDSLYVPRDTAASRHKVAEILHRDRPGSFAFIGSSDGLSKVQAAVRPEYVLEGTEIHRELAYTLFRRPRECLTLVGSACAGQAALKPPVVVIRCWNRREPFGACRASVRPSWNALRPTRLLWPPCAR